MFRASIVGSPTIRKQAGRQSILRKTWSGYRQFWTRWRVCLCWVGGNEDWVLEVFWCHFLHVVGANGLVDELGDLDFLRILFGSGDDSRFNDKYIIRLWWLVGCSTIFCWISFIKSSSWILSKLSWVMHGLYRLKICFLVDVLDCVDIDLDTRVVRIVWFEPLKCVFEFWFSLSWSWTICRCLAFGWVFWWESCSDHQEVQQGCGDRSILVMSYADDVYDPRNFLIWIFLSWTLDDGWPPT